LAVAQGGRVGEWRRVRQVKTRQDNIKQDKARVHKTRKNKENKTRQNKENKTRQNKENKTRQNKLRLFF
jgi:hypothetical protein